MSKILSLASMLCLMLTLNAVAQKKADAATVKLLMSQNAGVLGLSAEDIANTRVSSSYFDAHSNAVMAYLQQTYLGVDVYNAITPVAFRDDKVVSFTPGRINEVEKLITGSNAKATVAPLAAVRNAAADINLPITQSIAVPLRQTTDGQEFEYDKMGIGFNNIVTRLTWVPVSENNNQMQLAWHVMLHTLQSNDLWSIKVDAITGKILRKENLTNKETFQTFNPRKLPCFDVIPPFYGQKSETGIQAINSAKYNVIPYPYQDPNFSAPVLVTNPWTIFANTNATSLKWNSDGTKDYDSTKGNNVYAQPDLDAKDGTYNGATRSSTALPDLTFNPTPDFDSDPVEEPVNTNFAVNNLFYWNNIMHDMTYQYGFDEVSGNFQTNNQGRGGAGNDLVIADGQDGGGTNNANFATPADGGSPRMQMYIWNPSILKITKINLPVEYAGYKISIEGNVSTTNKLSSQPGGSITKDVALYIDKLFPDSSNACGEPANPADIAGKLVYIDRGSCNFTVKFHNAQAAGAKGIIVGNVADGDPRYTTGTGNTLLTMSATPPDNSILIPGVFMGHDSAQKIKNYLKAGTVVNATLSAPPRIDGDLDNGVVAHEYTHGISNRLTGGPGNSSCLGNAESMGEGWSDYFALMMTTDWSNATVNDGPIPRPIGNYASGLTPDYSGIRNYPYSTNFDYDPWTYDSLKVDTSIHEYNPFSTDISYRYYIGEVWCTTLWDMTWEIIKTDGINKTFADASKAGGNSIAMNLVIQGMKLQVCSPGCVTGRDGILKADTLLYGGKYSGAIWRAFAKRGLGYSASQGSNAKIKDGTAAYDLPGALPAIWGSFTAEKVNNTALLKWTTLTELNVDRFVVERTIDGRNYAEIASVKATGNSTAAKGYTVTDLKPVKGNNIYRIRLIDRDNKYNYSEARALNFGDIKNLISIAPNPARGKVILTVKENQKTLQVKLFNSVGRQVASYQLTTESMPIDVSRFAAGSYYISITGEGINQKEKLIIQ